MTLTSNDIGTVALPGSTILSAGVYTVSGSGVDIQSEADTFQFGWQSFPGDNIPIKDTPAQTPTPPPPPPPVTPSGT